MKSFNTVGLLACFLFVTNTSCQKGQDRIRSVTAGKTNDHAPVNPVRPYSLDQIVAELRLRQEPMTYKSTSDARPFEIKPSRPLAAYKLSSLIDLYQVTIRSLYGTNRPKDLIDLNPTTDRKLISLAKSVFAIFPTASVLDNNDRLNQNDLLDGTSRLLITNYGLKYQLCSTQLFLQQPTGAKCSGVVVGSNLVLTAGHCFGSGSNALRDLRFVFGFEMLDRTNAATNILNADIYKPIRIVKLSSDRVADWCLVEVDRLIVGRDCLPITRYDKKSPVPNLRGVTNQEAVFALGYPCGLPIKLAANAKVYANNQLASYFMANLVTYGGNSGSPVFATHHGQYEIVGLLVRGLDDFDFIRTSNCNISKVYRNEEAGELCVRTTEFADLIPR